jgi:dsRNA-specific ribonuclease
MNFTTDSYALKRPWSGNASDNPSTDSSSSTFHSGIPPLPAINGDILLQVLTHKSLRRSNVASEEYDNERLAELGEKVLNIAVASFLFNRQPVLSGSEMQERRKSILSEANLDGWVSLYGLREKVRCIPELVPTLKSPEETRTLFYAYVAGLYRDSGLEPVQQWLDNLTSDNTPIQSTRVTAEVHSLSTIRSESSRPPPYINKAPAQYPPPKRIKSDPVPVFLAAQPLPSSPPAPMPSFTRPTVYPVGYNQPQYPAMAPSFANPLTPAQPNLAFLPLFNQTASQRRVTVEYPAEFSGPSHAGKWTVRCRGL